MSSGLLSNAPLRSARTSDCNAETNHNKSNQQRHQYTSSASFTCNRFIMVKGAVQFSQEKVYHTPPTVRHLPSSFATRLGSDGSFDLEKTWNASSIARNRANIRSPLWPRWPIESGNLFSASKFFCKFNNTLAEDVFITNNTHVISLYCWSPGVTHALEMRSCTVLHSIVFCLLILHFYFNADAWVSSSAQLSSMKVPTHWPAGASNYTLLITKQVFAIDITVYSSLNKYLNTHTYTYIQLYIHTTVINVSHKIITYKIIYGYLKGKI